jgi:hypothetical protein
METVDVCIRRSLLRPEHKGGGVSVYLLFVLRDALKVPPTATLRVCDPNGKCASLGPPVWRPRAAEETDQGVAVEPASSRAPHA